MLDQVSLETPADIRNRLEMRLGDRYARQRLGIEQEHEGQIFGSGINFFHIENWYSIHSLIKFALKTSGLYSRGVRNAADIRIRHHPIRHPLVPTAFRAFTILQVSDLHCDTSMPAIKRFREILPSLKYDLCVLTGDYRGRTYGSCDATLAILEQIRA